jgi:hypothetical protein
MPTNRNAAATGIDRGAKSANVGSSPEKYTNSTDPVERLLSRLDRVRKSGQGWTARCPAHEDRTASLSITGNVAGDGRVLVHCFAGCSVGDVVAAAGLSIGDLFVKRPTAEMTFAERAALREHGKQAQVKAALNVLGLEAKIVVIAGKQIKAQRPLNDEDEKRLDTALQRIDGARGVLFEKR